MGADYPKGQATTSRQLKSCHPSGFAGDIRVWRTCNEAIRVSPGHAKITWCSIEEGSDSYICWRELKPVKFMITTVALTLLMPLELWCLKSFKLYIWKDVYQNDNNGCFWMIGIMNNLFSSFILFNSPKCPIIKLYIIIWLANKHTMSFKKKKKKRYSWSFSQCHSNAPKRW